MMRLLLLLVVAASGAVEGRGWTPGLQAPSPGPAAIVARTRGEVTAESSSGARPVRLFDRLHAGETIRTARGAEAVLVFRAGARMRLGETSRARIDATQATKIEGTVETLTPVSTVPLIAPVAGAGTTITAVRIRAGGILVVAPDHGVTTLAEATVLEFEAPASEGYDVDVEGPDASIVFRARVNEPRVVLPLGALQPDTAYRWRVSARLPTGFEARGEGRFRTLQADDAHTRARLRKSMADDDAESLALLAEVDRTLGLWREALAGFRAARTAGADDPIITERIADLERRLAGAPTAPVGKGR